MKTLFKGVIVVAFSIVLPVSAQQIQSVQTTSVSPKQGRVLLDSDTNETDGDPDRPIITGVVSNPEDEEETEAEAETSVQYNESDLEFIKERAETTAGAVGGDGEDIGSSVAAPEEPTETRSGYLKLDDIEGESTEDKSKTDNFRFSVEREMKESGEKGGTEDINIGVGELQEMNKADLIAALSTEPVETRAIYVKLGDIKGESDDSGSQAKKPKEIVVVGSKVRGWDPEKKEAIEGRAGKSPEEVATPDDLALFMAVVAGADTRMEEVTFNYEKIEFSYDSDFRLLGFIPMKLPSMFTIDTSLESEEYGRVKVKFPWYHVFGRKAVDTEAVARAEVETRNDNEHTDAALRFQAVTDVLLSR